MIQDRPSFTAQWVALMRGIGAFLPPTLHLVDDPYGLRFALGAPVLGRIPGLLSSSRLTSRVWVRGLVRRFAVYMQLRTRAIDDDVGAFAQAGGRQLVLMGAGFDCRAWRLAALTGATVFEVDHPATQAKKRAIMESEYPKARVVYVPWDFEHEAMSDLPARLAREGHDPHAPTMTILEGVLMYLTEQAIDATFACVASYSSKGPPVASPTAITYFDRTLIGDRSIAGQGRMARWAGEPFRSGFDPATISAWLETRGFCLERDESATQAAFRLLGPEVGRRTGDRRSERSHFALVRRT